MNYNYYVSTLLAGTDQAAAMTCSTTTTVTTTTITNTRRTTTTTTVTTTTITATTRTTTTTTGNRSTLTTTITTIEMPQRLIPNGSNDTPVYPAAAAAAGPTPLATTEKSSPLAPKSSAATTEESLPLPPPGRALLKEVRHRYLNATSSQKLDQSFVILIVDPKYFLVF
ncbi:hypothetical protein BHM03_00032549 [Ensete ventricosum]|nr:hypothetical protein BHM03_00032549 [Ensete ventricosum]